MPTLDDAIRVVTNRAYRATLQRSLADPAEMMPGAMVRELMAQGATEEEARALVVDAADAVGGRTWMQQHKAALGATQARSTWRLVIPARALRDPDAE